MLCRKIALIGVGLLGGSLGLATRQRRVAAQVHGFVRREASLKECLAKGAVDEATLDLRAAVEDADLVVFCTPLGQIARLAQEMLGSLKEGAIVTDVGSVKATVVAEVEPLINSVGAHFIGSHPMAGAEKVGVDHARADLFEGAVCAITPTRASNAEALRKVKELWRAVGARIIRLPPALHDELVSRSSHLPHVVAAELANYVLSPAHSKEQPQLCSNGFRDTTRIASGSPEMWRDIALANRQHLGRVLGVFIEDLQEFQHALEIVDVKAITEFFEKAKQRRDGWCLESGDGE